MRSISDKGLNVELKLTALLGDSIAVRPNCRCGILDRGLEIGVAATLHPGSRGVRLLNLGACVLELVAHNEILSAGGVVH